MYIVFARIDPSSINTFKGHITSDHNMILMRKLVGFEMVHGLVLGCDLCHKMFFIVFDHINIY